MRTAKLKKSEKSLSTEQPLYYKPHRHIWKALFDSFCNNINSFVACSGVKNTVSVIYMNFTKQVKCPFFIIFPIITGLTHGRNKIVPLVLPVWTLSAHHHKETKKAVKKNTSEYEIKYLLWSQRNKKKRGLSQQNVRRRQPSDLVTLLPLSSLTEGKVCSNLNAASTPVVVLPVPKTWKDQISWKWSKTSMETDYLRWKVERNRREWTYREDPRSL